MGFEVESGPEMSNLSCDACVYFGHQTEQLLKTAWGANPAARWPLALAVSSKLYICALAAVPLDVPLNSQAFRLITNGLIARFAGRLPIGKNKPSRAYPWIALAWRPRTCVVYGPCKPNPSRPVAAPTHYNRRNHWS